MSRRRCAGREQPGDPPAEQQQRAARHDELTVEARALLEGLDADLEWRRHTDVDAERPKEGER